VAGSLEVAKIRISIQIEMRLPDTIMFSDKKKSAAAQGKHIIWNDVAKTGEKKLGLLSTVEQSQMPYIQSGRTLYNFVIIMLLIIICIIKKISSTSGVDSFADLQRVSVLVQRYNAVLLHDTLPATNCTDSWSVPNFVLS